MPDMNLNAKSLLNQITNDVKMRSLFEGAGADLSNNSQFLDVMMARLTALGSTDSDLKALLKKAAQSDDPSRANETAYTQNLKGVRRDEVKETSSVSANTAVDANVKVKIKAKIKEIAQRHGAEVTDDRALKVLQKVADFLVQANAEGRIDLPPALVENLKAFLAKGDDFKAFDTAEFMHDFIAAFRTMVVTLKQPDQAAAVEAMEWPPEIMEALQELNMGFFPGMDGKKLDIRDIMQTVKALVNASETAAVDTLNSKADNAILPQDQAALLTLTPTEPAKAEVAEPLTLEQKIAALIMESVKAFQEQEKQKAVTTAQQAASVVQTTPMAQAAAPSSKTAVLSTVLASDVEAAVSGTKTNTLAADSMTEFTFDQNASGKKYGAAKADVSAEQRYQPASAQPEARQTTPIATASPSVSDIKANVSVNATHNGVTGITAADNIAHNVAAQPTNQSAAVRTALNQAQAQPTAATQQVIVQIQNKAGKEGQISVQLSPADLGRVDVRLTIDRNGQAHAIIMADRPETLVLLQKDAAFLERALQQAGINAQSQNMSFNLREQRQNEFGQGRKRFTRDALDETKPADMALALSAEGSIISDRRVNYHA